MMLGDRDIQHAIHQGELKIDPLNDGWLQPTSVDLRLDHYFRYFRTSWESEHLDPSRDHAEDTVLVEYTDGEPYILHPRSFVLASTFEQVELSARLAARVEGKSSLGRLGLAVHSTAGFIDPGFSGHITLELFNFTHWPIELWPGMKVAQLCIFQLMNSVDVPYGSPERQSRYQNQVGPTASRSHLNFTKVSTIRET